MRTGACLSIVLLAAAVGKEPGRPAGGGSADWARGFEIGKIVAAPGRAVDVFFEGGRLYVASEDQGHVVLSVFDAADPRNPRILGQGDVGPGRLVPDNDYREFVEGALFVRDGLAGIAQSQPNRLVLADASDPVAPRAVSVFDAETTKERPRIATFGNDVWLTPEKVAVFTTWGGVCHVLDVKDPARPRKIADIAPPQGRYGNPWTGKIDFEKYASAVWIEGNMAYVVWWVHGRLVTIDFSDPADPKKLGELETPIRWGGWAYRVVLSGKTAFLSADQYGSHVGGVHAVDVSDPANLKHLGFFPAKEYASPEPSPRKWTRDMALDGNHLFVTDYAIGVICLDVSNPAAMKLSGQLNGWEDVRGICSGVGAVYAAAGAKGLLVLVPKVTEQARGTAGQERERGRPVRGNDASAARLGRKLGDQMPACDSSFHQVFVSNR